MENYNGLCEPTEHCYHDDHVALLTNPPQYRMICCDCGHTIATPMASYLPPDEMGRFQ